MKLKRQLSCFLAIYLLSSPAYTQDDEMADIDEWQTLKVEAAKDPFANTNQFSINFANYAVEEWCYPLPDGKVISPYGGARHHGGTDIKTKPNDTIRAAFPGEVILSAPHFGYGNCIVMRHANGLETLYSHNTKNLVKVGQWIQAGEAIALTGRTGRATTEHLHFETRVKGKAFDSSQIFDHPNHAIKKEVIVFTKQPNGTLKISVSPR